MNLVGTYAGLVENVKDPEKLGRIKVRVPHVYGIVGGAYGAITTDNIPWAHPAGMPAGGSHLSGGMSWLPEVGDQVLVRFLDGEPEKPVWEWFMQTKSQAGKLNLHQYDALTGKPKRSALMRYGHLAEWNDNGLIFTTSKGYRLVLTDASATGNDGDIMLSSQAGNYVEIDDEVNTITVNSIEDFHLNVQSQFLALVDSMSIHTLSGDFSLACGNNISATAVGNVDITSSGTTSVKSNASMGLQAGGIMGLKYELLRLGLAEEPFVKGNVLAAFLGSLLVWLSTHTHAGVTSGEAITAIPTTPAPTLTEVRSTTIFGE